MLTDDQIAELERLEKEATAGPWACEEGCTDSGANESRITTNALWPDNTIASGYIDDDAAALIVAMRNALPELLREIRKARG